MIQGDSGAGRGAEPHAGATTLKHAYLTPQDAVSWALARTGRAQLLCAPHRAQTAAGQRGDDRTQLYTGGVPCACPAKAGHRRTLRSPRRSLSRIKKDEPPGASALLPALWEPRVSAWLPAPSYALTPGLASQARRETSSALIERAIGSSTYGCRYGAWPDMLCHLAPPL